MNERWINDSYKSAAYYKLEQDEQGKMRLIRLLDVKGLFETSWFIYDHCTNKPPISRYGYPYQNE